MKISRRRLLFFLLLWGISALSILIYYCHYSRLWIDIVYAIVLSFFSSLTTLFVFTEIEKSVKKNGQTCTFALLIVVVLYNQNSLTKYSVEWLFEGFISDRFIRLLGSIYIDLIIVLCTKILTYYRKTGKVESNRGKGLPRISSWIAYLAVFVYTGAFFLKHSGYTITRTMSTVYDAVYYLTCTISVLYLAKNKKKVVHWIPLGYLCLFQGYISIITGSKSATIKYLTIIGLSLYFVDLIKLKHIEIATAFSPAVLQVFTVITEKTSDRMAMFYSDWIMRYHAFRYDLSDFAITIAQKSRGDYALKLISDAITFAIPKYSLDKKADILSYGTYRVQMESIGLGRYDAYGYLEDFNDTLFSIGAELFGYIGIALFFLVTLIGIEFVNRKMIKIKKGYMLGLVSIGPIISIAECDLLRYVYIIRDTVMILLLVYMIIIFAIRGKNRKILSE